MDSWVHCTDFFTACKAAGFRSRHQVCLVCSVYLVYLVCPLLMWFNQIDETDQTDQINRSLLRLGLAGGLRLFSLEFGPAVIEPLRGCAGCIQRLGSFL